MKTKYTHTNIISKDWRVLARFYRDVLDCVIIPPERNLSGEWLDKGTGVKNAVIQGAHLLLPGYGKDGPTIEILQYDRNVPRSPTAPNREGIMHLAFEVEDIEKTASKVLAYGGGNVGEIASLMIEGVGLLT